MPVKYKESLYDVLDVSNDVKKELMDENRARIEDLFVSLESALENLFLEAADALGYIWDLKEKTCWRVEDKVRKQRSVKMTRVMNNVLIATRIAEFMDNPKDIDNYSKAIKVSGEEWPFLGEFAHRLVGLVDDIDDANWADEDYMPIEYPMHPSIRNADNARFVNLKLTPKDLAEYATQIVEEHCRLEKTWMSEDMAKRILGEGKDMNFWSVNIYNYGMMPAHEVIEFGIATRGLTWFEDYMKSGIIKTDRWIHTIDIWSDGHVLTIPDFAIKSPMDHLFEHIEVELNMTF